MMKYQVQFSDRRFVTVAVEANSEAEALALARRTWRQQADQVAWEEEPAVITAVPTPQPALETPAC